ncbi:hypothetical protein AJ80_07659 [Polytolypa hystricis UAMH7299]|uniref:REJ domain-containing protein n=1 Tax=Polytolypa hystricis (strain UAMH7299) TaxID=1447883 RepID=A0A2B7XL23_POLH7|nr:hypothetical protein AJ80_07659 [Polytolypa hystricis UAMH7299]
MQPTNFDLLGSPRDEAQPPRTPQITRDTTAPSRETADRSRNGPYARHTRSEDSWIEVSSQPSSSSLSSVGNDEIVTTGLRLQQQRLQQQRSRRRSVFRAGASPRANAQSSLQPQGTGGSSQDEYEESESESDRVLSSSNEDISMRRRRDLFFLHANSSASESALSSDDEDETSTALGPPPNPPAFTPSPNAFSHPPASQAHPYSQHGIRSRAGAGRSRHGSRSSIRSARQSRHHQHQHSPYNIISPSYQADHDAALRASLSTLLSCAAAARGLSKNDTPQRTPDRPSEPSTFRLVPESVAIGDDEVGGENDLLSTPNPNIQISRPAVSPSTGSKRSSSPSIIPQIPKARRKASRSRDRATSHPSSKRSRRVGLTDASAPSSSLVSPTVMTWVISAGVVVLFSAISFSAGYVLGREVGRIETVSGSSGVGGGMGGLVGGGSGDEGMKAGAGCGKEAVKGGLRRIRWIGGGAASSISA